MAAHVAVAAESLQGSLIACHWACYQGASYSLHKSENEREDQGTF